MVLDKESCMTALPINYPKPIIAKVLNSQSQTYEMMLYQHAIQLTLPIKEHAEAHNNREEEEGRDFAGSLA